MRSKWVPRRTKIDIKNDVEKKSALEDRLGAVLGRSWVVSGAVLGSCLVTFRLKTQGFVNFHIFEKMRCQEATWTDLGSIWEAKRLQNGCRGGSKSELR